MRGLLVTGTDTGVGKTVAAAAVCAALTERGERVGAYKPVVTGTDEPPADWPADDRLLALACGQTADEVTPLRFGPAVSPHFAAQLAGGLIDPGELVAAAGRAAAGRDAFVVEGVGGLLVPLAGDYTVRDLAVELGLPLLIAARTGLGTINHTLMTLEAARAAGLEVAAVVLTPWPEEPAPIELSNRLTIAELGRVEVVGLGPTRPEFRALARAGAELPLDDWL